MILLAVFILGGLILRSEAQTCRNETVCEVREVCTKNPNDAPIKFMAFNVQVFGKTKAKKKPVMDALVKIMLPYDIVMIQEIRDSSQLAIVWLLRELNKAAEKAHGKVNYFGLKVSKRQGRSRSKEQIGFIYNKASVYPSRAMNYEDGPDDGTDPFERDPYIVEFTSNLWEPTVKSFVVIGCHITPSEVVKELNAMVPVYEYALKEWGNPNIVLAGDFNADCSYLSKRKKEQEVKLTHDTRFKWLIGDDEDTTVAKSSCAYDRFIATGPWLDSISDVKVVDYGKVLKTDDMDFLEDVSDHYPIVMTVMGH